jgi:cystathionine gamma-synthase
MREPGPVTAAVRSGVGTDESKFAVVPPVYLSTTYWMPDLGQEPPYSYSRVGNPTRDLLGDTLARLESGAGAIVTGTGLGAMTLTALALLDPGDVLIVPHDCYGGTWRLFQALAAKGVFEVVAADLTAPAGREAIAERCPRMVWVESPSNPLLRITDIAAVAEAAHAVGALVAVDNTFCSPAVQRPLESGADLVIHSGTKYINGHSDVVIGAVVAATDELVERLQWWGNALGVTASAFDSYLTQRGLRTLHARMRVHQENTAVLVAAAEGHPAVTAVHYPGLPSHPGHELAARQQTGFGGMFSFELAGGRPAVDAFLTGLRHFSLAESLGGVESLVAHPATMTHAAMPPEVLQAAGITDGLLRFSVGIEDPADLVAALVDGLDRAIDA